MHSKDGMAGAHTINQHGILYYGYIRKIKSKVFSSTKPKHGNIRQELHTSHQSIKRSNLREIITQFVKQNVRDMLGMSLF